LLIADLIQHSAISIQQYPLSHRFGQLDAWPVTVIVSGGFGDLGEHFVRNFTRLGSHHSIKLFVDQRLNGSQFLLNLAPLFRQGGDLLVNPLQRRHPAMSLLKQRDCGGSILCCG
jgi:hypothetical protein